MRFLKAKVGAKGPPFWRKGVFRGPRMFVKGAHERQFAYEAHTACDSREFILGVEVTAGNVHDSAARDKLYDEVTHKHNVQFVTMDAGYKTPWIAKKTFDDGKVPILPYTRYKGDQKRYKPWEYTYAPANDTYVCPRGGVLRHTTTDRDGKRTYRSTPKECVNCPCKAKCGANEKGQKLYTAHIWQEYLDFSVSKKYNVVPQARSGRGNLHLNCAFLSILW